METSVKLHSSLFHLMCLNACEALRSMADTEADMCRNHAFEHFKVKQGRWRQVKNAVTHDNVYKEVKPRALWKHRKNSVWASIWLKGENALLCLGGGQEMFIKWVFSEKRRMERKSLHHKHKEKCVLGLQWPLLLGEHSTTISRILHETQCFGDML